MQRLVWAVSVGIAAIAACGTLQAPGDEPGVTPDASSDATPDGAPPPPLPQPPECNDPSAICEDFENFDVEDGAARGKFSFRSKKPSTVVLAAEAPASHGTKGLHVAIRTGDCTDPGLACESLLGWPGVAGKTKVTCDFDLLVHDGPLPGDHPAVLFLQPSVSGVTAGIYLRGNRVALRYTDDFYTDIGPWTPDQFVHVHFEWEGGKATWATYGDAAADASGLPALDGGKVNEIRVGMNDVIGPLDTDIDISIDDLRCFAQ